MKDQFQFEFKLGSNNQIKGRLRVSNIKHNRFGLVAVVDLREDDGTIGIRDLVKLYSLRDRERFSRAVGNHYFGGDLSGADYYYFAQDMELALIGVEQHILHGGDEHNGHEVCTSGCNLNKQVLEHLEPLGV